MYLFIISDIPLTEFQLHNTSFLQIW